MDIKVILGVIIRQFAMPVIVWLAATGNISTESAVNVVVGVSAAAIAIVWSFIQKWRSSEVVEAALKAPAGTSREQLNKMLN